MTESLRIGDVAARAGVNIQTLRYYERRGLVVAPTRRHSGHREYTEAEVTRVCIIKAAQRLGFTLVEIGELFALSGHRRRTEELRKRAGNKIAEIELRIAQLQTMRSELAAVIDVECDSLTDCSCGLGRTLPFVGLGEVGAPRRSI